MKYGPILGDVDLTQMDIVLLRGPPGSDAGNAVLVADIDGDSHRDLVVSGMSYREAGARWGAVWVNFGPVARWVDLADSDVTIVGSADRPVGAGIDQADLDGDSLDDVLLGTGGSAYILSSRAIATVL